MFHQYSFFIAETHVYTKPLSATKQRAFDTKVSKLAKEAGLSFITWN